MNRPFDVAEYRTRVQNTKDRMANAGFDTLLAADTANINYLTGYDGWSFYTPQVAVVALELEDPLCIVRGIDYGGARVTAFMGDDQLYGYPDDYVQSTERHPWDFIVEVLKDRGLDRGRVAVEKDSYYYTAASHEALLNGLQRSEIVDAEHLVNWVRVIKSPQEIAYMTDAARLVEKTMQAAYDAIAPGVRQCDAAAAIN